MKLHHIFISVFILSFFISCNKKKEINSRQIQSFNEIDSLEYSVFNQTLSSLSENILFNNYNLYLPKDIQLEVFNSNFKDVDKSELFKRILKEKIDTSKVSLAEIVFLSFNDSLTPNKNIKSSKLDLKKINFPPGTILINKNDEIIQIGIDTKLITLSRVVFNQNRTKAEYNFDIVRGFLNGAGYIVKCELKNGAWIVVSKKTTWIS
uniref:hypothetical protein n=1 Tax=Flavobacterium sp. TaxID=239 RepID=UPI0040478BB3